MLIVQHYRTRDAKNRPGRKRESLSHQGMSPSRLANVRTDLHSPLSTEARNSSKHFEQKGRGGDHRGSPCARERGDHHLCLEITYLGSKPIDPAMFTDSRFSTTRLEPNAIPVISFLSYAENWKHITTDD